TVPPFNQGHALAGTMGNWLRDLKKLARDFELIVIDDGSTDSTAEVAHGFAERDAHVKHVRHDQRRGSGASVRIGLASSRFPLVCTLACDYPYQPNDLKKLL